MHPTAQYNRGVLYADGIGVPRDIEQADAGTSAPTQDFCALAQYQGVASDRQRTAREAGSWPTGIDFAAGRGSTRGR